MTKYKLLTLTLVLFFLFSTTLSWAGDDKEKDSFWGGFTTGYRFVGVDGVETKYKEDYNLDDGPRLFDFHLHYLPDGALKKLFDRVDINLYNFGGDPFETFSVNVAKFGTYNLSYNRMKSAYFYQDNLEAHDFHHFDFDRIRDLGMLKVWLGKKTHFYFTFDRFSKKGNQTTTLDLQRDEFELERPVDETSTEISLGLNFNLKNLSISLEERITDYENAYTLLFPGNIYGEDPEDATELYFYNFQQPYDFMSYTHTLRLSARPTGNLMIKASAQLSDQELNLDYSETYVGLDYNGDPLSITETGLGTNNRTMQLIDVDISYLFTDKFAAVAALRYNNFDQDGEVTLDGETTTSTWAFNTLGFEAGLQYLFSTKFSLTIGFRSENRDVEHAIGDGETEVEETKRTGFFGNLMAKFSKEFSITADYQMGTYTNPFTFISPEDFMRLRITAKYMGKNFFASGSLMLRTSETTVPSAWNSDRTQVNLRAGWKGKKFKLAFGYGLIDIEHHTPERDIEYGSNPDTWEILYEGTTTFIDASLKMTFNKNWMAGLYLANYSNTGSWELSRFMGKAFVEYTFDSGMVISLGYRYIDYQEKALGLNDYTANIFEIGYGYRW